MSNPNPKSNLTEADKARGRATQGLTRRWYKATLLGIFKGQIKCTPTQLNALKAFADIRGWFPPARPKQQALRDKQLKPKPAVTDEVIQRLSAFNSTTFVNALDEQRIANKGN
jgi:hypothetical protein